MIYAIIPVHNRIKFTINCLTRLREQTVRSFKIIVIDDGSKDNTTHYLQENFPEVILLKGDGNLWWTGAINLGVEVALSEGADYILTLNNDTLPAFDY